MVSHYIAEMCKFSVTVANRLLLRLEFQFVNFPLHIPPILLFSFVPYLYGLVLVNAKAVHQTKDLLAVLSHACLTLCRQRLLVEDGPLHWNVKSHPFVLLNLG